MNFDSCLLKHEKGRCFNIREVVDHDSTYVLDFFGKHTIKTIKKKNDDEQRRLMTSGQWKKQVGENIVIVGIDIGNGDVQTARMMDCPKKWDLEDEEISISIGNRDFTTTLVSGTYCFPVQLLAKLDMQRSQYKPNCYLQMSENYNIPVHCIIPPHVESSSKRSTNDGKDSITFYNYIGCTKQQINSGGINDCIQIDSKDLRMLKNNTR
jgi:hypothetical protein